MNEGNNLGGRRWKRLARQAKMELDQNIKENELCSGQKRGLANQLSMDQGKDSDRNGKRTKVHEKERTLNQKEVEVASLDWTHFDQ